MAVVREAEVTVQDADPGAGAVEDAKDKAETKNKIKIRTIKGESPSYT